jgi:long-chain acyl-CoA synthetase
MAADYPTLAQRLLDSVDRNASPRAQMHKSGDAWQSVTAQEMLRRIAGFSEALAELGVGEGDRVAIFAPNCPEWHVVDLATVGLGAVVVPIYFRESPERIEYIIGHSGAKIAFVSGEEQIGRLLQIRARLTGIEHVIAAGASESLSDVLRYETPMSLATEKEIQSYRRRAAALKPGQLASIIYTSGTTGEPKGVMLSHANFVSNEMASFEGLTYGPEDVALSFLPLSHVYERLTDYGYLFRGIPIAYVSRVEDVVQSFVEVQPTLAAAVPRLFEKIYANIQEKGAQAKGLRRGLFNWAMTVAKRSVPWRAYGKEPSLAMRLQWSLADLLVYSKFRAAVGGKMRLFISGGAPLAPQLAEFFTTVGLEISQGYGLTETSPVITNNIVAPNRIGTVGKPIRDVQVRIADDGEILVRGPCVMLGYYQRPEDTREVISPGGWLSTGDIGFLDKDGYLVITDRKKDMLKTAGGKLVAPAPIENALKASPYVQNVALVGDKRRFVAALIVPNVARIEAQAREEGVAFTSPAEMRAHPWTRRLFEKEIARLTANLAQYETIKRFALIEKDFTFDSGELTYTLKLKRRVIEQRYADVIEQLYGEPAAVHP